MANPAEAHEILREWQRTPFVPPPRLADGVPVGLVLGRELQLAPD